MFGTEFAADKGVDVLNQLRIELIGLSRALFGQPALPLGFFGTVLLPLGAVPSDFATDGAFVAVKLFGDFCALFDRSAESSPGLGGPEQPGAE